MGYFTEADFKNLWTPEINEKATLPFPMGEELAALEKRLGIKLPVSYIKLATTSQNGGYLKRNAVPICDESGNTIRHVKIDYINPIGRRPGDKSLPKRSAAHEDCDLPNPFRDKVQLFVIGKNLDAPYDCIVLDYLKCTKDDEPTVAHIIRKTLRGKSGEPTSDSSDWRYINNVFYWEITTVAPTFDVFIKKLVVMPKLPAFDFKAIKKPLKLAAEKSFKEIVKRHGNEELISFGLYVDNEGTMVADAANKKAHLEQLISENPSEKEYYTYFINEWYYEGTDVALDLFEPICEELARYSAALGSDDKIKRFRDKLLDICVEVLAELKAENFFAKEYNQPVLLSASISDGDVSNAKRKKINALLA